MITLLLYLFTFAKTFVSPAYADTNCQSIYGGGQQCGNGTLLVQKQVLQPGTTNTYVDNLGTTDPKYQPNSPIYFKVSIKNTSSATLMNIGVKDTIDSTREFLAYTYGPGSFDNETKTLTYTIDSLAVNEERTFFIAGRTLSSQQVPEEQSLVCPSNTVEVTANNNPTTATTEFCIQYGSPNVTPGPTTKGGLPIPTQTFPVFTPQNTMTQTPKSGPEMLPLLALVPTGALGLWLRKKA